MIERGKMFWASPMEAISYAQTMKYSIDIEVCYGCYLCRKGSYSEVGRGSVSPEPIAVDISATDS